VSDLHYVFGYASLVALEDVEALSGRLNGFRRCWGAAMNNWEGGEGAKHYLDRASGERPRIRVAYLDLCEKAGLFVNGLALPVDADRLAALDEREINYERVDVSAAFQPADGDRVADTAPTPLPPASPGRVFTYVGTEAARERCRRGLAAGDCFVSRDYVSGVQRAFAALGEEASAEFDHTTDPLPFPERNLTLILDGRAVD
jgi:cation transport regulator ChaC